MSWTFRCLNPKCAGTYTQATSAPKCPKCKSKKARWLPRGIAVRAVATGIDSTARGLASQFNMSDFRTARAGEAVKSMQEAPRTVPLRPAGGQYGSVGLPVDQNGRVGTPNLPYNGAVCSPTGVGSSFRPVGGVDRVSAAKGRERLQSMTHVVARHKGPA